MFLFACAGEEGPLLVSTPAFGSPPAFRVFALWTASIVLRSSRRRSGSVLPLYHKTEFVSSGQCSNEVLRLRRRHSLSDVVHQVYHRLRRLSTSVGFNLCKEGLCFLGFFDSHRRLGLVVSVACKVARRLRTCCGVH